MGIGTTKLPVIVCQKGVYMDGTGREHPELGYRPPAERYLEAAQNFLTKHGGY